MSIFKKLLISFLIVSLLVSFFHLPALVVAATSPWTQTDWSGGSGQTSWSDTTKFDSSSGATTSTVGQVTIAQTANWYDSSWKYRRKVTFNNADQSENLTNFPVLVKLSSSRINYSQTQDAGQDIRFTDSDGTTLLSYEIESWNESGDSFVWVKIPQIDASSNTDYIYIYYGNSSASDGQSITDAWESNYQVVYHLKENPAGTAPQMQDSTSNNRDGTTVGGMTAGQQVTGKVNGSLDFDAVNDYVNSNFNTHYSTYTFEGWVKLDSFGEGLNGRFVEKRQAGTELFNIFFNTGGGNKLQFARGFSTARGVWSTPLDSIAVDTWYYLSITYDDNPANDPSMYLNGVNQTLTENEAPSGTSTTNTDNYIVGNRGAADRTFDGIIDEFRISNTIRSSAWVAASYKTQEDTFNTYASEEGLYASSGTLTSSIFDTEQSSSFGTLTYTATTPSNTSVTVKVRTSDSSSMTGATAFSSCTGISSGTDMSSNSCVTDSHRYIQYQLSLSNTDSASTPTFQDISIAFSAFDTTGPTLELDSPSDTSYTNNERPTFRWKQTSDAADYDLTIDNGDSGDFTISDIPVSRTSDYETSKYRVIYDGFSDSDSSNNYISVTTKSSSNWSSSESDGKLKEGKRSWKVKAADSLGNITEGSRTLFVDRTSLNVELTQINTIQFSASSSNNFSTNDTTPAIFGKVIDPLSGDSSSTSEQVRKENKVSSGPKNVEVKLEKKNALGTYEVYSLTTLNLNENYFTSDNSKVIDTSKQTSDKYSPFEFNPQENLPLGTYRVTLSGKDNADNTSGSTSFILTVTTLSEITTPEEKLIIEEETKDLKPEEREKIEEELEITKPAETLPPPSPFENVSDNIIQAGKNVVNATGNVIATVFTRIGHGITATFNTLAFTGEKIGNGLGFAIDTAGHGKAFVRNGVVTVIITTNQAIGQGYSDVARGTSGIAKNILVGIGNGVGEASDTVGTLAHNIEQGAQGTRNAVAQGITTMTNATKEGIANTAFVVGEKTDSVSNSVSVAIVKFGYLFATEPTKIYDVEVVVLSKTSAKISWQTNHPASGKVNYGLDETYPFDTQSEKRVTYHEFALTNLKPDTQYYFEVMSQNKNYVYDANRKFKTPKEK